MYWKKEWHEEKAICLYPYSRASRLDHFGGPANNADTLWNSLLKGVYLNLYWLFFKPLPNLFFPIFMIFLTQGINQLAHVTHTIIIIIC